MTAKPVHVAADGRFQTTLSGGHHVSACGSFDVDALCRVVRALGGGFCFLSNQIANPRRKEFVYYRAD